MIGDLRASSSLDLHIHTSLSDGRYAPDEVLRRCAAAKLDMVALTDHDLASPVAPGQHTIEGHTFTLLAGAEVSGTHEGHEYHLLVYFPEAAPDAFRAFCRAQCQARAERYTEAITSLKLHGVEPPSPAATDGERAVTRYHLAQALVRAGHATTTGDAFARYLSASHGHVRPLALSFVDAIRMARDHGGLTSWAHPPLDAMSAHVATFAAAGLQGLEAMRPKVNGKARKAYKKAAKAHGLFLTGGSDWHGWKGDPLGLFRVQAQELRPFVDALQAA